MTTTTKIRKPRQPELRLHKASDRTVATFSNPDNAEASSIESWKVWFGSKSHDAERRFLAYYARRDLADYRRPDEEAPAVGFPARDLVDRCRAHLLERREELNARIGIIKAAIRWATEKSWHRPRPGTACRQSRGSKLRPMACAKAKAALSRSPMM
ncbi:MAG: hypothetical protein ACI8UD_002970 [Planctomycetota bacterium]|jgi:hypothetical protein